SAKSQLNKAISDASWYSLRKKTEHQAAKLGHRVITVDPQYTSQQCSRCGYVSPTNRTGEKFVCESCDHYEDADIQGAQNIAERGKKLFFNSLLTDSKNKKYKSKTQKKSKQSKSQNQRTKNKSQTKKLPLLTRKVTPKSESTDSRKRDLSLGLPDEPGNPVKPDKPVGKQLSLFNLLRVGDGVTRLQNLRA
ncbi:MAG: zinc ribbon domain-containing protein, partial [Xenococcaceae cyanobacterium]